MIDSQPASCPRHRLTDAYNPFAPRVGQSSVTWEPHAAAARGHSGTVAAAVRTERKGSCL
jgi:hypothetical protein